MQTPKTNVFMYRSKGLELAGLCKGQKHYITDEEIQALDLMIAIGVGKEFCIGSIIKYASRYPQTKNVKDLEKISDYGLILLGIVDNEKEKN